MESGRYLGVGPSVDSPLAFGEVELVIDDDQIILRQATGNAIVTLFEGPRDALEEMSTDEVAAEFKHSADAEGVQGWRLRGSNFRLLLQPERDSYGHAPRLAVRGLPDERRIATGQVLPAMLFLPDQWERGHHAFAMAEYEKSVGLQIGLPCLASEGRPRLTPH